MDKKKQGIALFITLMVIASIMSIVAVSFSYLEKAQKDAGITSTLIQGDLLYNNTVAKLKQFFPAGKVNSERLAQLYNNVIPINEDKSGFSLTISCKPLMVAAPISWLEQSTSSNVSEKNKLTKKILNFIMEEYDVQEANKLEESIMEAITGKHLNQEEFIPRIKKEKGIFSYKQFKNILNNHILMNDDPKVLTIPWDRYFTFTNIDKNTTIDGRYISAEFLSAAFDVPLEVVQDNWDSQTSTLSSFLKDNGISEPINNKIYSKEALNAMHCKQTYIYKERQYGFNFDYVEGRSYNFEFNRQKH